MAPTFGWNWMCPIERDLWLHSRVGKQPAETWARELSCYGHLEERWRREEVK